MVSFRTLLQIFSLNTIKKSGRSVEVSNKLPEWGSFISTSSFWTQKTSESNPVRKKPSDNPLISKGAPSKCLEGNENQNLEKVTEPCKKESFWVYLFGEKPKVSLPDPCTCRLAHKFNEIHRKEDPRLSDPRYSKTAGDVLLFTEFPKPSSSVSPELQPQPPPSYKIPSAVTCKRIADAVAEHTCVYFRQPKVEECEGDKCLEPKPFRLPYAEFKPTQRSVREPFTCKNGKREENVMQPIRKEMYPYGFSLLSSEYVDPGAKLSKKSLLSTSSSEDESDSSVCKSRKKISRMERLKKLTAGKQGVYHPVHSKFVNF